MESDSKVSIPSGDPHDAMQIDLATLVTTRANTSCVSSKVSIDIKEKSILNILIDVQEEGLNVDVYQLSRSFKKRLWT